MALLGAGLVVLLLHRSQQPVLAGRYSLAYALLIVAYVALALTALVATSRAAIATMGSEVADALLATAALLLPHALHDVVYPDVFAESEINPLTPRFAALTLGGYVLLALASGALALVIGRACRYVAAERGESSDHGLAMPGLALALPGLTLGALACALGRAPAVAPATLALGAVGLSACGAVALLPRAARPHVGWIFAWAAALLWSLGAVRPFLLASPDEALAGALGVLSLCLLVLHAWTRSHLRRALLLVSAMLCAVVPGTGWRGVRTTPTAVHAPSERRPNVVVVVVDTLRADHLGAWGYGAPTSPALDRLTASEPRLTVFAQAWSAAASTIPSIAALFTSAAPSHGSWETAARRGPRPPTPTLAEAFQRAGYATAGFTANPLVSGTEFQRGFETYRTLHGVDLVQRSFLFGRLLSGADELRPLRWAAALDLHKAPGEAVVRAAQAWMARSQRPFFAYLHLMEPHWPYGDHGYALHPAPATPRAPFDHVELLRLRPGDPRNARLRAMPEWAEFVARYDQEVRHADECFAKILAGLRLAGLRENSLVVLLGDHGEELLEHDGFGHGYDVYPEQVHVPLVVMWPAGAAFERLPRRVEAPVSLLDVFPTLADYAGTAGPGAAAEGRSLRALLAGGAAPPSVLAEAYGDGAFLVAYREGRRAVRLTASEAHEPRSTTHVQIFDAETGALAPVPYTGDDATVVALVERARAAAARRWEAARGAAPRTDASGPDDAAARLRALGYIE